MKNLTTLLALLASIIVVEAAPITFIDTTLFTNSETTAPEDLISYGGSSVGDLNYTGDFVRWAHNYEFVPPASEILAAELTLNFSDIAVANPIIQHFDLNDIFSFLGSPLERAVVGSEGVFLGSFEVDTGARSFDVNLTSVEDGRFDVQVTSTLGNFRINRSDLRITYEPVSEPVPEPSTIVMFGAAFSILGFVGYRSRNRKS